MVIIMRDGGWYAVTDAQGQTAIAAVKGRGRNLEIDGQMVSVSAIAEILEDEKFEIRQRQKAGDRQCKAGFWHSRNEQCGHTIPAEGGADRPSRPAHELRPPSNPEHRAKWLRILSLNAHRITEAGQGKKIGLIKTFAELAAYEKSGEWPDYLPIKRWPRVGANGLPISEQ